MSTLLFVIFCPFVSMLLFPEDIKSLIVVCLAVDIQTKGLKNVKCVWVCCSNNMTGKQNQL